jgi:hypothetical protein
MTGELHESEVTRDAYPIHFDIADLFDGTVRPFDQYQGPYVLTPDGDRLWLCSDDGAICTIYNDKNDKQSEPFLLDYEDTIEAINAAQSVT